MPVWILKKDEFIFNDPFFRCEKEEDLAMIAAQQYYIEYNTELSSERLLNLLPNYIPDYCLTGDKPVDYWHQLITQAFRKVTILFRESCPNHLIYLLTLTISV